NLLASPTSLVTRDAFVWCSTGNETSPAASSCRSTVNRHWATRVFESPVGGGMGWRRSETRRVARVTLTRERASHISTFTRPSWTFETAVAVDKAFGDIQASRQLVI
ncbi:unnamed protein product, partial [Mycena citricolor]